MTVHRRGSAPDRGDLTGAEAGLRQFAIRPMVEWARSSRNTWVGPGCRQARPGAIRLGRGLDQAHEARGRVAEERHAFGSAVDGVVVAGLEKQVDVPLLGEEHSKVGRRSERVEPPALVTLRHPRPSG